MQSKTAYCSSSFRKDNSTAGLNAICFSSTKSNNSGISAVSLINLWIWLLLSPTSSASNWTEYLLSNFSPTWAEVKSVLLPWCVRASNFILYANAFSLGNISSLCKLLSTIIITASSSVKSLTIQGSVSLFANWLAYFLLCPDTISYLPSGFCLTNAGTNTPFSFMLSRILNISSFSMTLNGWSGKSSISLIFSNLSSVLSSSVVKRSSNFGSGIFGMFFAIIKHLLCKRRICICYPSTFIIRKHTSSWWSRFGSLNCSWYLSIK